MSQTVPGTTHHVPASVLRTFAEESGRLVGIEEPDLELFADAIIEADLRGIDSHGSYRLPLYGRALRDGAINARPGVRIVRHRSATMVLDADNGLGVVVGQQAMDHAIVLAAEHGIGVVAVRNSNHSGMLAIHVLRAVQKGMIGYFVSNAPALMAPWGGRDPLLSNSPFAYAFPTSSEPVVLDMACSAVSRGRIRLAAEDGLPIPDGWALDADGHPARDARAAMEGLILPMAGYKGYALAFVNEILSGALPGARLAMEVPRDFLRAGARAHDAWAIGHVAVALDIEAFGDRAEFIERVDGLIDAVRRSNLASGFDEILVPGDPEARTRAERVRDGVPLPPATVRSLREFATELGLDAPV